VDPLPALHRSSPAELQERLVAERTGVPFLVMRDGEQRQRITLLRRELSPLSVGRQHTSDLALTWDDEVSRAHADIECLGEVWTVVDDGRSRNGSFVGDERVYGRRRLLHGDVIRFGRTIVTYLAPGRASSGSTATCRAGAPPQLSDAQRRVLIALARPLATGRYATVPSNREIAQELSLSVETVKFHLHAMFELFGITEVPQHRKRAALAQLALERGAIALREFLNEGS
jgi:hypothetical protein